MFFCGINSADVNSLDRTERVASLTLAKTHSKGILHKIEVSIWGFADIPSLVSKSTLTSLFSRETNCTNLGPS